jgi:hypothetical protein
MNMFSSLNNTPRLTITNGSSSQQNHPNTTTTATIPIIRSTIDDFREIVREQSFINPNHSTTSDHHHHIDVPIKKYPPLPDITIPSMSSTNNTFFRTETILTPPKTSQSKKQMFYHFASTQRGQLPALNKHQNLPTISNMMDLDEDLPQCNANVGNRAATYTSPGDRIISPIKRPSAPSPPTSAQVKRPGQNAFDYAGEDEEDEENHSGFNDEDSQLFDEHFYSYHQPTIMNNHRIDHYNSRHQHTIEKRSIDSNDFES